MSTATQRPPQAVPQADDDERDDGSSPMGVMTLLSLVMLLFWAGCAVGFISALQVRLP